MGTIKKNVKITHMKGVQIEQPMADEDSSEF